MDGAQWFELELGVVIGGQRVPIVAALADWIRRTSNPPLWLDRLSSHRHTRSQYALP